MRWTALVQTGEQASLLGASTAYIFLQGDGSHW